MFPPEINNKKPFPHESLYVVKSEIISLDYHDISQSLILQLT